MRQQDDLGRYKCSRCGDYKHFHPNDSKLSEFGMNRRETKQGIRKVPMAWCKQCVAERKAERRLEAGGGVDRPTTFREVDKYLSNDDEVIIYLEYRYGEDWVTTLSTGDTHVPRTYV